jgi:N-terminal region of glycosyl transferase group 7
MPRLAIIIPYRDRPQHLAQIIPHLAMYFTRDKIDSALDVHILVVEHPSGAPFNRGLMLNIGFKLMRDSVDYVCLHDVDYLPIWADYRYPEQPTMIVWDGFSSRPVDPSNPAKGQIVHNPPELFSAVVLVRVEQFERANGFEDNDLKCRLERAGYRIEHRMGTFQPLAHRNEGYVGSGQPSTVNLQNHALFQARWATNARNGWESDGLNSTTVRIVNRGRLGLPHQARSNIHAERVMAHVEMPAKVEELVLS